MASTASPIDASSTRIAKGVAPLRAGQGSSFVLRRLHSLSGIVPIGAFLIEHFISNSEAANGVEAYNGTVKFLTSLPFVHVLEWVFIFIPILYHALYGIYIWYRGDSNVSDYPWTGNWLYTSQRWTGIIAFVYILYHVIDMRFMGVHLMGGGYQYAFSKVWFDFPESVGGRLLRHRNRCRVVALRLRRVAVCRQVGNNGGRESAAQVRFCLPRPGRCAGRHRAVVGDRLCENAGRPGPLGRARLAVQT